MFFWLDEQNTLHFRVAMARVRAGIFVPGLVNRARSARLICPPIKSILHFPSQLA